MNTKAGAQKRNTHEVANRRRESRFNPDIEGWYLKVDGLERKCARHGKSSLKEGPTKEPATLVGAYTISYSSEDEQGNEECEDGAESVSLSRVEGGYSEF